MEKKEVIITMDKKNNNNANSNIEKKKEIKYFLFIVYFRKCNINVNYFNCRKK
jgi:hypothetical protein